jgi:hypothetical protein
MKITSLIASTPITQTRKDQKKENNVHLLVLFRIERAVPVIILNFQFKFNTITILYSKKGYYYCKNSITYHEVCPERQLFNVESKLCKEYQDVYCGDRPVNDKGKDQCQLKQNGVYPNLETGCTEYFQCHNQRKTKSGVCQHNMKFNALTLRCDYPINVPIPCGSKTNGGSTIKSKF